MSDTFKCSICLETYEKKITDEEALENLDTEFHGADVSDCGTVCEDCFRGLFEGRTIRHV